MKMKKNCRLIFKKKFQVQLEAMTRYLAALSPQAARNMHKTIFSNIQLLKEFPQMGKILDIEGLMEKRLLIAGKYLVLYIYVDNEIHIEMILDEKQDYQNYM